MQETGKTDAPRAHFVILGAGAVGLTLAAFLSSAGQSVTLVVRDGARSVLPVTIQDEIGHRELSLREVPLCPIADLPRRPDHLLVCTRGEQLRGALASLRGRVAPDVPVTVAAATLEGIDDLARTQGLPNPMLRMAVGFAAWHTAPHQMRVFSLRAKGSAIGADSSRIPRRYAETLVSGLAGAGMPAQAAPPPVFGWIFHTTLAIETIRMLGFREAGWDLDELARRTDLVDLCGRAMHEAAHIARPNGGPIAWTAALLPNAFYRYILMVRARRASPDFREVWRHHGPKIDAQLDFCAQELTRRSQGRSTPALDDLLRRAAASKTARGASPETRCTA